MEKVTIKSFEKAKRIYDSIISLDKEIIWIERLANEVATDECKLSFSIKVDNITKSLEKTRKQDASSTSDIDDAVGNMYRRLLSFPMFGNMQDTKETQLESHDYDFSDSDCLKVLAVVLRVKYDERKRLIDKLSHYGVSIQ